LYADILTAVTDLRSGGDILVVAASCNDDSRQKNLALVMSTTASMQTNNFIAWSRTYFYTSANHSLLSSDMSDWWFFAEVLSKMLTNTETRAWGRDDH